MSDAQLPLNSPSSEGSAHEIMLPTFRVGLLSPISPFQKILYRRAHRPASPTQLLTVFTDDSGPHHVDKTNCHSVILGKPPRFMSYKRNSSCCSVPSLPNWTTFSRLSRVPLCSLDWLELAMQTKLTSSSQRFPSICLVMPGQASFLEAEWGGAICSLKHSVIFMTLVCRNGHSIF